MANSAGLSIEIVGTEAVAKELQNVNSVVTKTAIEAVTNIAGRIQAEARASAAGRRAETRSFKTGNFSKSINFESEGLQAVIYSDIEYAKYLEYGTSKMMARRHFRNTAARETPKAKEYMQKKIDDAMVKKYKGVASFFSKFF